MHPIIDHISRSRGEAPKRKESLESFSFCSSSSSIGCGLGNWNHQGTHEKPDEGLDVLLKLVCSYCLCNGNTAI